MHWYILTVLGVIGGILTIVQLDGGNATTRALPALPPLPSIQRDDTAAPQSHMQGVRLIEQTDVTTSWEVFADQAARNETTQIAVARGVQATFFREDGILLSLEADEGRVRRASGDMDVHGHVRLQYQDGYIMTTPTLQWQASSRILHTTEDVQIQGPAVTITGTELHSDVEQQHFSVRRNVHASFQLR
jgi:LPS export ABC transporter protein LptC